MSTASIPIQAPAGAKIGPRAAFAQRGYRNWFFAQIFSSSGGTTQMIGQSWLITQSTHSGFALAFLAVAGALPSLLLGPIAGSLIDRVPRRRLLVVTNLCFIAIGLVLLVSTLADGGEPLWLAYSAGLATGVVTAFDAPARQVYVMELVPRRLIGAAVGLNEVVINAARVVGPSAAGVLLAAWGVVPCFAFNALAYLPALLVLLARRPDHVEDRSGALELGTRPRASTLDSLRWTWSHPDVFWNVVLAALSCMIFGLTVTLPLMTTKVFHLGGGGYGIEFAMFGVGALFGAMYAATRPAPPTGRETRVVALITGGAIVVAAISPDKWLFGAAIAVIGCFSILWIARANTLVQLRSPAGLRGRVMALWSMAIPGTQPIMALGAGAAASVDPRFGFGLSGVLFLTVVLGAWRAFDHRVEVPVDTQSVRPAR